MDTAEKIKIVDGFLKKHPITAYYDTGTLRTQLHNFLDHVLIFQLTK